jgi:hypothetical protein
MAVKGAAVLRDDKHNNLDDPRQSEKANSKNNKKQNNSVESGPEETGSDGYQGEYDEHFKHRNSGNTIRKAFGIAGASVFPLNKHSQEEDPHDPQNVSKNNKTQSITEDYNDLNGNVSKQDQESGNQNEYDWNNKDRQSGDKKRKAIGIAGVTVINDKLDDSDKENNDKNNNNVNDNVTEINQRDSDGGPNNNGKWHRNIEDEKDSDIKNGKAIHAVAAYNMIGGNGGDKLNEENDKFTNNDQSRQSTNGHPYKDDNAKEYRHVPLMGATLANVNKGVTNITLH